MSFDIVFQDFDADADHLDRIPLALYYMYEYKGISKSELIDLFASSDVHLSLFSVGRDLDEVESNRYIEKTEFGGYRLTATGRGVVEKQLHTEKGSARSQDLVDENELPKDNWQQLAREINKSYQRGIFSGATVLYRTLIEDILYFILIKVPDEDIAPYKEHDDESDQNRQDDTLSEMITKFRESEDVFKDFGRDIDRTGEVLDDMRKLGNDGAHSTRYNPDPTVVDEMRADAKKAVSNLIEILNEIESNNDSGDDNQEFHGDLLGSFMG
jgi:hypothetical protein